MPTRQSRPARSPAIATAIALLVTVLAAPSTSGASSTDVLPPQGLYEGCSPGTEADTCIEHLEAIRAAGFSCVLNYSAWYGSPTEVLRYAEAAAMLGLKLIWPLNNPAWRGLGSLDMTYSTFAPGADGEEFTASAIGLVADHPATWGFYIGDELPAGEAAAVGQLSMTVRGFAPAKPQLYVARPGLRHLQPFARFADFLGADAYPIGSADPPVNQVARSTRAAASSTGARTAMVLQAFSWSQYRQGSPVAHYPNVNTLRIMRDAAIRHAHPALILWYSYQDVLRSDDPALRWRELIRAAFAP